MSFDPESVTEAEFIARAGEPAVRFQMPVEGLEIPHGEPGCCRVVHQRSCGSYVAWSIVGGVASITYADGHAPQRRGARVDYEGDILADPLALSAAAKTLLYTTDAAASALGGTVSGLEVVVWLLDVEMAEAWAALRRRAREEAGARIRARTGADAERIKALPFKALEVDPDGELEEAPDVDRAALVERALADLLGRPDFMPVSEYAQVVAVVPGELGHDGTARYLLDTIWAEDGRAILTILGLTELGPRAA